MATITSRPRAARHSGRNSAFSLAASWRGPLDCTSWLECSRSRRRHNSGNIAREHWRGRGCGCGSSDLATSTPPSSSSVHTGMARMRPRCAFGAVVRSCNGSVTLARPSQRGPRTCLQCTCSVQCSCHDAGPRCCNVPINSGEGLGLPTRPDGRGSSLSARRNPAPPRD